MLIEIDLACLRCASGKMLWHENPAMNEPAENILTKPSGQQPWDRIAGRNQISPFTGEVEGSGNNPGRLRSTCSGSPAPYRGNRKRPAKDDRRLKKSSVTSPEKWDGVAAQDSKSEWADCMSCSQSSWDLPRNRRHDH